MEIRYLNTEDALANFAEAFGVSVDQARNYVKDWGMLESALARPINAALYEDADLITQAATLLWGLIKNHPFHDGNKRSAYVSVAVFLELNGWTINATEDDKFAIIVAAAEGAASVAGVEAWLASHTRIILAPPTD